MKPDTVVVSAVDGAIVTVDTGGVCTKTHVIVFPDALLDDKTIIMKPPDATDISADEIEKVPSTVDLVVVGSEDGFTFDDLINIIVEYKDFEVENDETNMRVHVLDKILIIWKRVRGDQIVNIVDATVTVITNHFSIFGVLEIDDLTEETPILSRSGLKKKNSNIYEYDEVTNSWNVPSAIENRTRYILYGFKNGDVEVDGFEETGDISHSLSFTNNNG